MEIRQLELDLWESLDVASQFPETADLRSLCNALEETLGGQSIAAQLTLAGDVLMQCSEVYAAKADLLISRWERRHSPMEPIVDLDNCIDLFVQSLSLDLTELFDEPELVNYPANRKPRGGRDEGSIVAEVEKEILLNWVDQMQPLNETQMADQIIDLAHGENVEEWSRAINRFLKQVRADIRLLELQEGVGMAIVELWLGLLLGGFALEQQGEFYSSQDLWIIDRDEVTSNASNF